MKKSSAVFSMLFIIALIITLFLPDSNSTGGIISLAAETISVNNRENVDYNELRMKIDAPAELPFSAQFDEKYDKRDFRANISVSVNSGYYSKPQTVYFESDKDLYYTVDGTIPDTNSIKYDKTEGIYITENTFICICEANNGKLSDVCFYSYVILKDATYYKSAYGYNSLDSYDQYMYEFFYDKILKFEKDVQIGNRGLTYRKVQKILRCINYDNPLLFQTPLAVFNWSGTSDNVTKIVLNYDFSEAECNVYKSKTILIAENILKEADGSQSLMEYLDNLHYSILQNAVYNDDGEYSSFEAFGVLVNKKGVCESYSRAFQYLCQRIGVQCILVVGDCDGIGHMWNMLCLDGEWYHTDLTWDDGDNGDIYYDYFNINDKDIKAFGGRIISPFIDDTVADREILDDYNIYPIPPANGEKYNYVDYWSQYSGIYDTEDGYDDMW